MIRHTFPLLALATVLVAGCGPNRNTTAAQRAAIEDGTNIPDTPTELAAYAGNARFPETQPVGELRVAAVMSRDKKSLKLYNFGTENIRDTRVWVNGSYVKRIGGVAPLSSVTISANELYNGLGHTLATRGEEVSRVQLQTMDRLYNLMGPVTE